MSYTNRNSGQTRGTAWIAVAALHGAALYALINGLGIAYITETIANLPARNYDTPAPPPPEAMPDPKPQNPVERAVDVVPPVFPTITHRDPFVVPLPQLPPIGPVDLAPIPDPAPPGPMPSFKPVGAVPKGSVGGWVTTHDYPTRDLRQGHEGTAEFTLTIGADGRVSDCRITRSTGHPGLDQATCSKVSQRARFTPARNENDQPVTGTFSSRITWVIPD